MIDPGGILGIERKGINSEFVLSCGDELARSQVIQRFGVLAMKEARKKASTRTSRPKTSQQWLTAIRCAAISALAVELDLASLELLPFVNLAWSS